MMQTIPSLFIAAAIAIAVPLAARGDDVRVRRLEADVQRLEREIATQSRRIEQLERTTRRSDLPSPIPRTPARRDASPAWLVSSNWDRIRHDMLHMDVIALLGQPNAVRVDEHGRTRLLYALEIGKSSVLAGNVLLDESGVVDVVKPTLR